MWLYNDQEFMSDMIENSIGFVYILHNITNDRFYIGKKLFKKRVKKKKKRVSVESDWKTYQGSNLELLDDIKSGHEIKKTILHLAYSKGELSYLEIKEQIERKVLFSKDFYNSYIGCRIHAKHIDLDKSKALK